GGHPRAWLAQERHAVAAAKLEIAKDAARGRVAAVEVALGILGQPDRDDPPAQLLAVAPAQNRQIRAGAVGEGATRVGELRDRDLIHMTMIAHASTSSDAASSRAPRPLRPGFRRRFVQSSEAASPQRYQQATGFEPGQ